MRGLNLEKTEVGTRPDGLSLSNMGSQVRFHPEGDEGGDKVRALISNQYGVPGVVSTSRNGGGDKAGTRPEGLSSTNMGRRCGLNLRNTGLSSQAIWGSRCLEKTAAGTRPEGLSSTNMGSQVRGLNLKKTEDSSPQQPK